MTLRMVGTNTFNNNAPRLKMKHIVSGTLSYFIYIFLNAVFFNIGLTVANGKLAIYPHITGGNCGNWSGRQGEMTAVFAVFMLLRVLLVFATKKWLLPKSSYYGELLGIYLITDFLYPIFCLALPLIHWDFYFFTAYPLLGISSAFSLSIWVVFLLVASFDMTLYAFMFEKSIKRYGYYLLCALSSFTISFLLYYLYFGRIFYKSMFPWLV